VQPLTHDNRSRVEQLGTSPFAYNIAIEKSADCVLENVTLYSGRSSMACNLQHNHGRITVRGFKVMIKPATDRAISNWRDGIHCKDNRVGPIIEQCHFANLLDDSINISQNTMMAEQVISPNTFRLTQLPALVPWTVETRAVREGDRLMVFYPTTGEYRGPFKVTRIDPNDLQTVTLDQSLQNVITGGLVSNEDNLATHFYNLDQGNAGFVIRNNYFGPLRRLAILVRSQDGVIVNNEIAGSDAIKLSNEIGQFYEGPFPRNIVISGNTIRDCYWTPICVAAKTGDNATGLTHDITIKNNYIVAAESPAIHLTNTQNIGVENGNVFVRPDGTALPDPVRVD